ncbi:MAG: Undecaprenol kinase [bacterium ADurb.Bin212]|nr:MAG: Undecaprenol kinase [bacterium ADurb.Bin212]
MQTLNLKKLARSFHYAFRGVIHLLTDQQNARIHASAAIFVGILAYLLDISRIEAAVLFIAIVMVFAMEIINTAIEKICDLVDEKDNEVIRKIKDGMAGSVLIAATIAAVVALLIFLPHIKNLF